MLDLPRVIARGIRGAEEDEETQTAVALKDFTAELEALRAEVALLRASLETSQVAPASPGTHTESGAAPEQA